MSGWVRVGNREPGGKLGSPMFHADKMGEHLRKPLESSLILLPVGTLRHVNVKSSATTEVPGRTPRVRQWSPAVSWGIQKEKSQKKPEARRTPSISSSSVQDSAVEKCRRQHYDSSGAHNGWRWRPRSAFARWCVTRSARAPRGDLSHRGLRARCRAGAPFVTTTEGFIE